MATGYATTRQMEYVDRKESPSQISGSEVALAALMLPAAVVGAYYFVRILLAVLF